MDYWEALLERFLQNKCTEQENKFVFCALRDGVIDDEFLNAIESVMQDSTMNAYIEQELPVSNEVLKNIRMRMNPIHEKKTLQPSIVPDWLKIAVAMLITFAASWFYFDEIKEPDQAVAMNIVSVPAGQTAKLTLSDGSNIWLNSRTEMKYPGIFTGKQREVILDGEGYFEIAHGQQKPFVVHAGEYDIRVLGTEFNVDAYSSSSNDFSTALLKGSVKVSLAKDTTQSLMLQPNTMARIQDGILKSDVISDFDHYHWRRGLIYFNDMSFADLMRKFEKCYGIGIVIENGNAKNYVCTGKFRQSDGVDYALRVLQKDVKFKFVREEEKNIIYIK